MKIILSIAGSDSGGGAGIQADIKTISALGGFAATAITALTAQNTLGVREVSPVPASHVRAQIAAVLEDMGADAIKIGMLHHAEVIEAVAQMLETYAAPIVLDPVMVATSGDRLLGDDALTGLQERLIPLASVLTPNLPEAEVLLGKSVSQEGMDAAAQELYARYGVSVLLKGGHCEGAELVDVLYDGQEISRFVTQRIETKNTHGTGCTLSSALATYLAQGLALKEATKQAQSYVHGAIKHAPDIGKGNGPLAHLWNA